MNKLLWNSLIATTAILGTSLIGVPSSQALPDSTESLDDYSLESSEPMEQLTSVSELTDVAPTEWAYEALRSLVERYGCIVGYPDRTHS